MKRIFAVFLVVCLLCSLSGCVALDEMRKSQAFLQADGDIVWQENTYRLLPEAEELFPELNYENQLAVTAPDVPLLLSVFLFEKQCFASKDGKFLQLLDGELYCRADAYEEISRRLREGFEPEIYCYFYDVYDEENWDFTEEKYVLTAEQVQAVETVCSSVEPYSAGELGRPEAVHSVYLYGCSGDMLQQSCNTEILATTAGYSILLYTEEDVLVFPVPEGMHDMFNKIMEAYILSGGSMDLEADI